MGPTLPCLNHPCWIFPPEVGLRPGRRPCLGLVSCCCSVCGQIGVQACGHPGNVRKDKAGGRRPWSLCRPLCPDRQVCPARPEERAAPVWHAGQRGPHQCLEHHPDRCEAQRLQGGRAGTGRLGGVQGGRVGTGRQRGPADRLSQHSLGPHSCSSAAVVSPITLTGLRCTTPRACLTPVASSSARAVGYTPRAPGGRR